MPFFCCNKSSLAGVFLSALAFLLAGCGHDVPKEPVVVDTPAKTLAQKVFELAQACSHDTCPDDQLEQEFARLNDQDLKELSHKQHRGSYFTHLIIKGRINAKKSALLERLFAKLDQASMHEQLTDHGLSGNIVQTLHYKERPHGEDAAERQRVLLLCLDKRPALINDFLLPNRTYDVAAFHHIFNNASAGLKNALAQQITYPTLGALVLWSIAHPAVGKGYFKELYTRVDTSSKRLMRSLVFDGLYEDQARRVIALGELADAHDPWGLRLGLATDTYESSDSNHPGTSFVGSFFDVLAKRTTAVNTAASYEDFFAITDVIKHHFGVHDEPHLEAEILGKAVQSLYAQRADQGAHEFKTLYQKMPTRQQAMRKNLLIAAVQDGSFFEFVRDLTAASDPFGLAQGLEHDVYEFVIDGVAIRGTFLYVVAKIVAGINSVQALQELKMMAALIRTSFIRQGKDYETYATTDTSLGGVQGQAPTNSALGVLEQAFSAYETRVVVEPGYIQEILGLEYKRFDGGDSDSDDSDEDEQFFEIPRVVNKI